MKFYAEGQIEEAAGQDWPIEGGGQEVLALASPSVT